jgi:hypothetical protein
MKCLEEGELRAWIDGEAADQAAAASVIRDRATKALGALVAAESALVSAAEEVVPRRG